LTDPTALKPSLKLTQIITSEWFAKALARVYRSIQRRVPNDDLLQLIGDLKRFTVATCGQVEKFAVLRLSNGTRRITLSTFGVPSFLREPKDGSRCIVLAVDGRPHPPNLVETLVASIIARFFGSAFDAGIHLIMNLLYCKDAVEAEQMLDALCV